MNQHPIDLLPEFVRIKSQQGVRAGRYIASVALATALVVIATTYVRFELDRSRERLARAQDHANIVIQLEGRAAELGSELMRAGALIELHEALSFPFDPSRVMATMINQLPASVTLERMEIDANPRAGGQRQRQQEADQPARRESVGELAGFAASDDHIGELITNMESSGLFHSVTWDFSRSRLIRSKPAREFRVSFRIDLDLLYEVALDSDPDATDLEGHDAGVNLSRASGTASTDRGRR